MVKTITIDQAKKVWESPDGVRKLFGIKTTEGEEYKTYSEAIGNSRQGEQFSVVTYQREGNYGVENFAKQARTDGDSGGRTGGAPPSDGSRDPSFALSYAKDLACALVTAGHIKEPSVAGEASLQLADSLLGWLRGSSQKGDSKGVEPDADYLVELLKEANLLEAAKEKQVTKAHLAQVFQENGGSASKFVESMKSELDDPLPF